jgi:hypothetical protein
MRHLNVDAVFFSWVTMQKLELRRTDIVVPSLVDVKEQRRYRAGLRRAAESTAREAWVGSRPPKGLNFQRPWKARRDPDRPIASA